MFNSSAAARMRLRIARSLRAPLGALTVAALLAAGTAFADVPLDGRSVPPECVGRLAAGEAGSLAPAARQRVVAAHEVLVRAAAAGQQIYGLTVGVGLNKDREMVDAHGKLSQEVIDASTRFNI
ncbi:aromatic amino acid ammonia-lyase, partial [Burkholderia pseudomallei]|uniref:aromatic amino acid ammonia-lyase n=1 Tax=Burkholderia pseudomallei TaxID=28450 RepID=UPI0021F723BD